MPNMAAIFNFASILDINFNYKKIKDSKVNALTSLKKLLAKFKSKTSEKYNQMPFERNQNKYSTLDKFYQICKILG